MSTSYWIDGIELKIRRLKVVIQPEDKNNKNKACQVISLLADKTILALEALGMLPLG